MKRFVTPFLIATFAIGGSAFASEPSQDFAKLDADQNGVIDREEAREDTDLEVHFNRADQNADGALSQDEYQQIVMQLPPENEEEAE